MFDHGCPCCGGREIGLMIMESGRMCAQVDMTRLGVGRGMRCFFLGGGGL